jgi:putative flippase GtrA
MRLPGFLVTSKQLAEGLRRQPLLSQFFNLQFLRFLMVGASNFVISFVTFRVCLSIFAQSSFSVPASQLVSYGVGILWSFFWNRRLTFASRGHLGHQAARFITLQVVLGVLSAVLIAMGVQQLGLNPSVAWFIVMSVITIANFLLTKWWAFK